MKSIGTEFLRPDVLPVLNHMRGMPHQIVLNIVFSCNIIIICKLDNIIIDTESYG